MAFVPRQSLTESIVAKDAGWMEFDLLQRMGYQELRGMFTELGPDAQCFNAYLTQIREDETSVSTTPVQFHAFAHSVFLAPPGDQEEFYAEIPRHALRIARVYFRIPQGLTTQLMEGYKPPLQDLYAVDFWTETAEGEQVIWTLIYEADFRTDERTYHVARYGGH